MSDITFVDGLKVKKQDFNNGGFILKLGIKFEKFIEFAGEHLNDEGFINIDICSSKGGNWYAKLNDWKKQ